MKYGIVIPSKYDDVFQPLLASMEAKIPNLREPAGPHVVIVADGHDRHYGFDIVQYDDRHFCYGRAVNLGINRVAPCWDILLLNDDCRILEWNFFDRLAELAYADPKIGILSPLVMGAVGNPVQHWYQRDRLWKPDQDFIDVLEPAVVCFPCVYIKRDCLNDAGLLKEQYASYGYDDVEMCSRVRKHGWKTTVTQRLVIQHGDGSAKMGEGRGTSWASSFARRWAGGVPPPAEVNDYLNRRVRRNVRYGSPGPQVGNYKR